MRTTQTVAPGGSGRARVLDALRSAGSATALGDLADTVGLHPNTVRFHLDALEADGLVRRVPSTRRTPGRPPATYELSQAGALAGPRDFVTLASALAQALGAGRGEPLDRAVEGGYAAGRRMAEQVPDAAGGSTRESTGGSTGSAGVERLVGALEGHGCRPRPNLGGPTPTILFDNCPFREVADRHPEVVCQLHLGMVRGLVDGLRIELDAVELEPRGVGQSCVLHLS